MITRIVLASRNPKKAREVTEILAPVGITVIPVSEFPGVPEVIEDGQSFAENAAKKASEVARRIHAWVIGEDSGLTVDALNGAPGIYSARYSGPDATDDANNARLMKELAGIPDERRTGHYHCSLALADPTGSIRIAVEGTCRGRLTTEPRGTGGFGYDPYFLIPEYHRTFAELGSTVKHRLSHRARAFAAFVPLLKRLLPEM